MRVSSNIARQRLDENVTVATNLYSNVDLQLETVTDIIAKFANSHHKRLQLHINREASRLLNVQNIPRRLKRKKPFELVTH
jgi:uncharacterized protein YeeX (DUF496 family)